MKSNILRKSVLISKMLLGKVCSILGYILLVVFGLGGLVSLPNSSNKGEFTAVFVMLMISIFLIRKGWKIKQLIKIHKSYSNIIAESKEISIDEISRITSQTSEIVLKNLKKIIDKGFLENAYINIDRMSVVIKDYEDNFSEINKDTESFSEKDKEMVTVECRGCGAVNKLEKSKVGECEFCGSSIQQ